MNKPSQADADSTAEEIPEAEVVEDDGADHQAEPAEESPGPDAAAETALEPRAPSEEVAVMSPHAGQIIRAEEPEEIIEKAAKIARALGKLIADNNLAANVGGRKPHVEVGGWQACGAMLGALGGQPLHAEPSWIRRVLGPDGKPEQTTYTASVDHYKYPSGKRTLDRTTTYEVDGYSYEARVEIKMPDGTVVGSAEAMCHRNEQKWSQADEYAIKSMAETRAESRAWRRAAGWLVAIAGYNPTPAEEMPGGSHEPIAAPLLDPPSGELEKIAKGWLVWLLAGDVKAATAAWQAIAKTGIDGNGGDPLGHVPKVVAQAIARIGTASQKAHEAAAQATREAAKAEPNELDGKTADDVAAEREPDPAEVPDESKPADDAIPF